MSTVLITGASRGIGLELTRLLHARGDTVIATSRSSSDELDALDVRKERLDVTDQSSVDALAKRLDKERIDTLINNAGVLHGDTLDRLDFDEIMQQIQVNTLGPLRVTAALKRRLRTGSKVAIITSRMGSIGDNDSGGAYGYRLSKAAVNAVGRSLAIDLGRDGIPVVLLHPGFVRTDMTGGRGNWDAPDAAAALIERIDELDADNAGRFLHANGEPLPW